MSWVYNFTEAAQKDLKDLPRIIQKRVARTVEQMSVDPFHGDVRVLKGEQWKGVFRRRIGSDRILFKVDHLSLNTCNQRPTAG
jgi:mRNA-degrading endonuclease RelE of RelBE toxin-antitoxin system